MTDLAAVVGVPVGAIVGLVAALADRGLTVATAESLTGGLLAAVLTEIPGSSAVVRGGLVVYATELKHRLADVDPILLAERGPVDPLVAAQLADGARRLCGASIGIGLTGVAGPDPQDGIAVGTWYCAVSGPGDHRDERRGLPAALEPDEDGLRVRPTDSDGPATTGPAARGRIRAAAVRAALDMLGNIAAKSS